MRIESPWLHALGGLALAGATRGLMGTLEYKCAYYDRSIDPVEPTYSGQKLYLFWHEYILFPLYLRGHNNLAMLLSRHRDAEILSYTAYHMGFDFVRGSTNRGGVTALRELLRKSARMNLTITPDGPRGPRRTMAPGPIFLASRLGLPLVLMGFGYDRPWRTRSWDRFAIPRPFTRARACVSPELRLPADLDRDGLEHYRLEAERMLVRLTEEAEAWAESGTRKANEVPIRRQARYRKPLRIDETHSTIAAPHFSIRKARRGASRTAASNAGSSEFQE